MSFYGQVVYEFKKLFNKIKIKNDGFNKTDIPETQTTEASFTADVPFDTLNLNSGNRWIHLDYQNTNSGNEIIVSHGAPADKAYSVMSFNGINIDATDKTINQLSAEQVFSTTNFEFDIAGHLVKEPTESYYKLPPSIISITNDENDTPTLIYANNSGYLQLHGGKCIELNNKDEKCIIQHTLAEITSQQAQSIQLEPGQEFTINDYIYDECGHAAGIQQYKFILPITDLEADLTNLQTAVVDLQTNKANAADLTNLQETVSVINNKYLSIDKSGTLDDIYENTATHTFASTIGQVDGDKGYSKEIAKLLGKDTNTIYSIGDSLSSLASQISINENVINGVSARLTLLIAELKKIHPDELDVIQ